MILISKTAVAPAYRAVCVLALVLAALALGAQSANAADTSPTPPSISIVNGTVVPNLSTEWPFIVALVNQYGYQFCGGTLIKPNWVLTAAHCDIPVGEVLIGRKRLSGFGGELIPVDGSITHPAYVDALQGGDVQLLRLSWASSYGASALPLISAAEDPPAGATVSTAGWGDPFYGAGTGTDDLMETDLQVDSNATCNGYYAPIGAPITPSMICAEHFSPAPATGACQGDSGGPLVYLTGSGLRLAGITSFGVDCAYAPYADVFTRVSSFADWISAATSRSLMAGSYSAEFANQMLGTSSKIVQVSLESAGDNPVTISGVSTTSPAFVIVDNSCTGALLPTSSSCTISLAFNPSSLGYQAGDLVVSSDDATSPTMRLPFTGVGIQNPNNIVLTPVTLSLKQSGRTKLVGKKLTLKLKASYQIPIGTPGSVACLGSITAKARIRRVRGRPTANAPVTWSSANCVATIKLRLARNAKHKRAVITLSSTGNRIIAPASKKFNLRIK